MSSSRLLLIDGHSLAYRAYYALPPMHGPHGEATHAIAGFLKMLFRLADMYTPQALAIAFDTKEPTFRHIAYPDYKGHRPPSPPDFHPQLPRLFSLLEKLGVHTVSMAGYEADDIMATLAERGAKDGMSVSIVTGDKDVLQLVSPHISICIPKKGLSEITTYTPDNFVELTGLTPSQIVDYKSLRGDPSDNIKGVPGIGEKTAIRLLQTYGSLAAICSADSLELSDKLVSEIENSQEVLRQNQMLTTLDRAVPLPANCPWDFCGFHYEGAIPALQELGLKSLSAWCDHRNSGSGSLSTEPMKATPPVSDTAPLGQLSLF